MLPLFQNYTRFYIIVYSKSAPVEQVRVILLLYVLHSSCFPGELRLKTGYFLHSLLNSQLGNWIFRIPHLAFCPHLFELPRPDVAWRMRTKNLDWWKLGIIKHWLRHVLFSIQLKLYRLACLHVYTFLLCSIAFLFKLHRANI